MCSFPKAGLHCSPWVKPRGASWLMGHSGQSCRQAGPVAGRAGLVPAHRVRLCFVCGTRTWQSLAELLQDFRFLPHSLHKKRISLHFPSWTQTVVSLCSPGTRVVLKLDPLLSSTDKGWRQRSIFNQRLFFGVDHFPYCLTFVPNLYPVRRDQTIGKSQI